MDIPLNVGDYVLGGRFKNQRQEVKSLGTDELGQPTYNKGKKLLAVRIEKTMPPDKQSGKTKREKAEMEKKAYLDKAYKSSFGDEFKKLAGKEMEDAFYNAQKRIRKEERSRGRKNLAIGSAVTLGTGAGLTVAYKKSSPKVKNFLNDKLMSSARKVGSKAGQAAGVATNAAGESYKNTLKEGTKKTVDKFRGGSFVRKTLKKIIMKGK